MDARAMTALRGVALAVAVLCCAWASLAGAQQAPFMDFGRGVEDAQGQDRAPDLQAYGEIAETYRTMSTLDATQQRVARLRDGVRRIAAAIPDIGPASLSALASNSPGGEARWYLGLGAFLVLLLAIGRGVASIFAVYAARPLFMALQRPDPQGYADKLPVLAARVALVAANLAVTLAVAALIGSSFYPDEDETAVRFAILVFAGYAAIRIIDTLWRMILAPYLPEYRIPCLGDHEAARLYAWLSLLTVVGVASLATIYWLEKSGMQPDALGALRIAVLAVHAALALACGRANRAALGAAILGGRPATAATWPAAASAALWGPALTAYFLLATGATAYRILLGVDHGPAPLGVAFMVVTAALTVYATTIFAVERIGRRWRRRRMAPEDAGPADAPILAPADQDMILLRDPRADGGLMGSDDDEGGGVVTSAQARPATGATPAKGMRSYEDLARRVASLFALGSAVWALAWVWGGPGIFDEGAPLNRAQNVIDILLIGYVLYHAARIWIDQRIAEEGGEDIMAEPGDEGGAGSAASRLATLLPLVRNFVLLLIAISCAIFTAMELGVNVAPLVGGAGIIGIAIGFGSQTLIRDILSGAFFLADDAFRKGEYINIGDVKGTVEKISLRSFQLRHHLGALNTVPFGEVKFLTNYSRDWVMMKLPLRLTYDTDPEKVRKLIKKLGERLLEHPEEGRKFLMPLKSQGVYMMEDSAMIIRVKYMTRPGDQWTTRKLVYQEIRQLFEREGIHFAHKEVTVRIPGRDGAERLTDEEAQAVGAAARRAVDDADAAAALRPRAVGDDR